MTLYIYREETEDTFPCLEFQKPHPQDMDIVLEGATDVQGTILAEALNVEFETGKTPRQLAEENAKLRAALKRFVDLGFSYPSKKGEDSIYVQASKALEPSE